MSHKVHPKSFRIKGSKDWDSRGFYEKEFKSYLEQDFVIRKFLKQKIGKAGVGRIEIERSAGKINIIISAMRPGLIIGRGGEGIEMLKKELASKIIKKKAKDKKEERMQLRVEVREIKNPWASSVLVGQWMSSQIEKRIAYRRVLKKALAKIMTQKEIKGARVEVSGRLNGIAIARREWLQRGLLPRQTLRADIDYAQTVAFCSYGSVGIKVWIYKGEKFD